jgi:excisionase family DNA binding protein
MSGVVSIVLLVGSVDPSAEFMNAQALATHLGVTERTVRRWIERGELDAEKRGRSFVIRREDGERVKLGGLGRVLDNHSALEDLLAARDRELAKLQGRYDELSEYAARLEQQLDAERRRAIRLEVEHDAGRGETRLAA